MYMGIINKQNETISVKCNYVLRNISVLTDSLRKCVQTSAYSINSGPPGKCLTSAHAIFCYVKPYCQYTNVITMAIIYPRFFPSYMYYLSTVVFKMDCHGLPQRVSVIHNSTLEKSNRLAYLILLQVLLTVIHYKIYLLFLCCSRVKTNVDTSASSLSQPLVRLATIHRTVSSL